MALTANTCTSCTGVQRSCIPYLYNLYSLLRPRKYKHHQKHAEMQPGSDCWQCAKIVNNQQGTHHTTDKASSTRLLRRPGSFRRLLETETRRRSSYRLSAMGVGQCCCPRKTGFPEKVSTSGTTENAILRECRFECVPLFVVTLPHFLREFIRDFVVQPLPYLSLLSDNIRFFSWGLPLKGFHHWWRIAKDLCKKSITSFRYV